MKKIIWHLPYAIVGGVETLYATILKFMANKPGLEHYVTCHTVIKNWVQVKYKGLAKIFPYSGITDLANAIKTIDPHLVMGTHGMTLYHALEIAGKYPVIEIVHGSHVWVEHNSKMPKDWTKHIVCVSKSALQTYLISSKVPRDTSIIINGVDTTIFYPRKHFQPVARNIGYFGRFLEEDKHLEKMIDAFRSIGNTPAKLYLIGGSPVDIVRLKRYVKKKSVINPVKFFAHAEEPQKFYEELDMCTVRSQAEGYCNSAAESLASGTPLVCYNFGGILDHVPDGCIVVGKSQAEYASKLLQVFKDDNLRRTMRQKGLEFVKEEGNARIMADRYYELINSYVSPMKTKKVEIPFVGECVVSEAATDPDTFLKTKKIVGVFTPYWHGIAKATKMVTNAYVHWDSDYKKIVSRIIKQSPDAVLFSGLPEGFAQAAELLRNKKPHLPIYAYYHGGASHFSFSGGIYGAGERKALEHIIALAHKKVFNKIAVSSPGMEEVGKANNIPFVFCGNLISETIPGSAAVLPGFHIGNWNRHLDHKHTSIGIAAANLIERAKVHMLECPYRIPFLDYSKVRFYKEMSEQELYQKYRQMSVNLQISFIETFNISVLEMWACGTPVILGPGNYVFIKDDPYLKEMCYVEDHTNPQKVAEAIKIVQYERKNVVSGIKKSLKSLLTETKARWFYFFKE